MRWYVPPAKAMGTFLRTWRVEWAGLTRAQLATAVAAHCGSRHRVTPRVILGWEDGQPPQDSEELNALLLVMRAHGLEAFEARQFREAVFAACADRRFPEFFEGERLAHRRDIDQVAEALYRQQKTGNLYWQQICGPSPWSTLQLVAAIEELRQAVAGTVTLESMRSQARKREVALAYLMAVLPDCHIYAGRRAFQGAAHGACADFLQAHFGPRGLGGELTVLLQRARQAHAMAHTSKPDQAVWARQLLGLHDQALAMHGCGDASHAVFCWALDAVGELEPGAYSALQPTAQTYLRAQYWCPYGELMLSLAYASLAEDRLDDTERWLELVGEGDGTFGETINVRTWMAMQRGDHDEAKRLLEARVRGARGTSFEGDLLWQLELCDSARKGRVRPSFRDYRLGARWRGKPGARP